MLNFTAPNGVWKHGYFGPVTATLDWCEANYQFTHYIAELANTFSNLFAITLAWYGAQEAYRQSLPLRYIIGYAGIALVGIGSFAFHATLLYEAQLADELPMIYVGSMSLWLSFDTTPGFGMQSLRTRFLAGLMVLFDILFTYSYYLYRNPVYHQVVFATIVLAVTARITYLLRWSPLANRIPAEKKAVIGRLFSLGAGLFAFGFFIWNLDNIFCVTLTNWKHHIGWPIAFALEGHSWWHIFTGAGTHLKFIGIQYITLSLKDDPRNYELQYIYGLPVIQRIKAKKAL